VPLKVSFGHGQTTSTDVEQAFLQLVLPLAYLHNYYKFFSFTLGFVAFISSGVTGYMQFIPHARVPVLQYVSNRFGISCDISIDNFAGRIKSKIFYWINTLDERFGDMVLLV
jgi:hypothetical protein